MLPFVLVGFFPAEQIISQCQWDGNDLKFLRIGWDVRHWFSSGVSDEMARKVRGSTCYEAWRSRDAALPNGCAAFMLRTRRCAARSASACIARTPPPSATLKSLLPAANLPCVIMPGTPARRWDALMPKSICRQPRQLLRPAKASSSNSCQIKMPPGSSPGAGALLVRAVYCTFAVTDEFAFNVSVQVLVLAPPLEHAPPQIASRPLAMLSVTAVPGANCVLPVLPVATLRPAGFETTRSPLRPPAVTASDMLVGATTGFSVRVAERVTPPPETEIVTSVCVLTGVVLMKTPPVVLPAGISTRA